MFENFRNKCIEIYELDPAHFLSSPGLAWQACLKNTGVRLKLLPNIDMLLMVEKEIRGRICHAIHKYAKANNCFFVVPVFCISLSLSSTIFIVSDANYGNLLMSELHFAITSFHYNTP